jgi:hypothetical protein
MPRVSVLLPTYARNATGHLSRAISSVLAQTYRDFELIVVDDGSRDGSQQTIEEFCATDRRVKTRRFEQNVGLPALTTGLTLPQATGSVIAWQFDDCTWEPKHLELLIGELDRNAEAGVAYGQVLFGTAGNERPFGRELDIDDMLSGNNHVPNVGAVVRRSMYDRLGWVDPHILLKRVNDWEMWARACRTVAFAFVRDVVAQEDGAKLADSLGSSVSIEMPLALRYAQLDRREALQPACFAKTRPFQIPAGLHVSNEERVLIGYLIVEHFFRIGRPPEAVEHLANLGVADPPWDNSLAGGSAPLHEWFIRTTVARGWQKERELNDYIQRQRRLLDERGAHIDRQDTEILALRARLERWTLKGRLASVRRHLLSSRTPEA